MEIAPHAVLVSVPVYLENQNLTVRDTQVTSVSVTLRAVTENTDSSVLVRYTKRECKEYSYIIHF